METGGNDTMGDLDFQIEIGDNTDDNKKVDSMGSGPKNAVKQSAQPAELTEKQKKMVPRFLKGSAHPFYCMLHLGFKLLALVCYLILGIFINDKTFCFLVVIILSAIDFWIVKNITGR